MSESRSRNRSRSRSRVRVGRGSHRGAAPPPTQGEEDSHFGAGSVGDHIASPTRAHRGRIPCEAADARACPVPGEMWTPTEEEKFGVALLLHALLHARGINFMQHQLQIQIPSPDGDCVLNTIPCPLPVVNRLWMIFPASQKYHI
ncbi:hypothetical protein chiPu_0018587 [Chiloscyllium punctatum]|uniref:Uncharacterized protein n=1 Tax=Chiloscyllium punctatum TaxID=137246 RepID=A0A401RNW7_CHIPU|nr:hypothetical protein [Chiloscyllium punctatum]